MSDSLDEDALIVDGQVQGDEVVRISSGNVDATELLRFVGPDLKWLPLGRFEIAGTALVMPGLKVRAGGGLNLPGTQKVNLNVIYMFGRR